MTCSSLFVDMSLALSAEDGFETANYDASLRAPINVSQATSLLRSDLHIWKCEVDLNPPDFFLLSPRAGLRRRSGAFSVRVEKYWNRLPESLVLSPSVSIFNEQLDRQLSEIVDAVPFIDIFSLYCNPRPFMLSFPQILLMFLLLALVVIPSINQWKIILSNTLIDFF